MVGGQAIYCQWASVGLAQEGVTLLEVQVSREPYARFLQGLTAVDGLLGKDRVTRAINLKDLQVAHGRGQPALVQSIEGAHFLEGHLERVEEVYKRGLRHLPLLHDKGDKVELLGDIF